MKTFAKYVSLFFVALAAYACGTSNGGEETPKTKKVTIVFNGYASEITGATVVLDESEEFSIPLKQTGDPDRVSGTIPAHYPIAQGYYSIILAMFGKKLEITFNRISVSGNTITIMDNTVMEVRTAQDLIAFAGAVNVTDNNTKGMHCFQRGDIDMSGITGFIPIGRYSDTPYEGIYYGGGYRIKNLKITSTANRVALFGHACGLIRDVNIDGSCELTGAELVSGVAAVFYFGKIVNCSNAASITATKGKAGGICGSIELGAQMTGCSNSGTVTIQKEYSAGGLSAKAVSSYEYPIVIIRDCHNTGKVVSNNTTSTYDSAIGGICGITTQCLIEGCINKGEVLSAYMVGGIIGENNTSIIRRCRNEGDVIQTGPSKSEPAGGIAGESSSSSSITECANTGIIVGYHHTGGICGHSLSDIEASFNKGKVTGYGEYTGGLVGENLYGDIYACYNRGDVECNNPTRGQVGGLCGSTSFSQSDPPLLFYRIESCYTTGRVLGSARYMGVMYGNKGYYDDLGKDSHNYYLKQAGVNPVGYAVSTNYGSYEFSAANWPSETYRYWALYDGDGETAPTRDAGSYWKSVGSWNGGTPSFPVLWWE